MTSNQERAEKQANLIMLQFCSPAATQNTEWFDDRDLVAERIAAELDAACAEAVESALAGAEWDCRIDGQPHIHTCPINRKNFEATIKDAVEAERVKEAMDKAITADDQQSMWDAARRLGHNDALEEAAKVCESFCPYWQNSLPCTGACNMHHDAKEIRARKSKPEVKSQNSGKPWRHEYGSKEYWRDSE